MALSPQLQKLSLDQSEKKKLTFDILFDKGNEFARQLGLVFTLPEDLQGVYAKFGLDLPNNHGDGKWELPMPARIVIDGSGVVRYAESDPDYTVRPEPTVTVEALKKILG